jgi:hypothetical protein
MTHPQPPTAAQGKQYTDRGFRLFADMYGANGQRITVVQSAEAGPPRCWIFSTTEPLLTPAQAKELAHALLVFVQDAREGEGQ